MRIENARLVNLEVADPKLGEPVVEGSSSRIDDDLELCRSIRGAVDRLSLVEKRRDGDEDPCS